MSFLYPNFLFALFTIIIPIIIHLFNFRSYKTVYFSNVKFLKDIKQETRSKSTLKHLLVLISRILAIASLVIAFAQPYIPSGTNNITTDEYKICIYIDNSFSTEAESKYGKISELSKNKALKTADIYPENTKFLFLTNDFDQKHQHYISKEQLKDFILETEVSPSVRNLSDVINKSKDFFNENSEENCVYTSYIISDFQRSSSDLNKLEKDSLFNVVFIPVEAENMNNMYIDSVWFEEPERPLFQSDEIYVKITNKSEESYSDIPIKLYLDDTLKATGSFSIDANESKHEILSFINEKTGIIKGKVEISDFPITYDNEFLFNFDLNDNIQTLIITNKQRNKHIENVFKNIQYVTLSISSANQLDYDQISEKDVIILDEVNEISDILSDKLVNFTSDGGKLIIFPGINTNIQSHNKLYNKLGINLITGIDTSKIYAGKINYDAQIFKNVFKIKEKNPDLPYFFKRVKFSDQTQSNEEVILLSERNDKLISSAPYGFGKIYLFCQVPNKNSGNLIFHPIWAPMIYNMVVFNTSEAKNYYIIGNEDLIRAKKANKNKDHVFHIKNIKGTFDLIPRSFETSGNYVKISAENSIKEAGHYFLESNEKIIKGLSYNYNRTESDLSHYSFKDIENHIIENNLNNYSVVDSRNEFLSESLREQNLGKKLLNLFLILALIFLLAEILLIRLLK